jgi:hypothetical protein
VDADQKYASHHGAARLPPLAGTKARFRAEIVDRKCALALLDDSEVVDMRGD